MSAFDKISEAMAAVRQVLQKDVRDLFRRDCRLIDDVALHELRDVIFTAIEDPETADAIVEEIAQAVRGRLVSYDRLVEVAIRCARRVMCP